MFEQCTDTIVRQVDDIKRMVDEFSRFARMPKPVIDRRGRRRHGAAGGVPDARRQSRHRHRRRDRAEDTMPAQFDRRLISQALTNIIKNATEAIAAVPPAERGRGRIRVAVDARRRRHRHRRDRQRHRPAEGKPQPAARALCHDAREGHRPRSRHRRPHSGRARRRIELLDAPEVATGGRGAWMRLRFAAESVGGCQTRA